MKYFVFAVLFAAFLELASADKEIPVTCKSHEDCGEEDHCCLAFGAPFWKGKCKKFAKEGETCSSWEDQLPLFGNKFYNGCPCEGDELECKTEKVEKVKGGKTNVISKCVKLEEETEVVTEEVTEEGTEEVTEEPTIEGEGGEGGDEEGGDEEGEGEQPAVFFY